MKIRFLSQSIFLFIFLGCLFNSNTTSAFCIEKDLNEKEVLENIKTFLFNRYPNSSYEYFSERCEDKTTTEVELSYEKRNFNITFDSSGKLIETEREIKFKEIELTSQKAIDQSLLLEFGRYSILSAEQIETTSFIYEIKISTFNKNGHRFFEVTFSPEGTLISSKPIEVKSIETLF